MNSPGGKTRLFSDDGLDASRARCEPPYVYCPDESTLSEIKFLFSALKSTERTKHGRESEISIKDMPYSYDLSILASEGDGEFIALDDVINGMCRIATHFISAHELIQSRANAYIRCKLAGAESILNGMVVSQNEQAVERDQILLSSMTVPSSPRDGLSSNHEDGEMGQLSRTSSVERFQQRAVGPRNVSTPPPSTPALFRSPSVRQEQMRSFPASVIILDDETIQATLNFLPDIFESSGFVSRKVLSPYDADKLQELWEFFDHDYDGIVTRDDLLLGVANIAKNYIATDSFTQLMAHAYVQRKIRRAILAIRRHQQALETTTANAAATATGVTKLSNNVSVSNINTTVAAPAVQEMPSAALQLKPGATVVYTDEEGNNHVTKVIRLSNRPIDGHDAYYIETKGVKLYVPIHRLRTLSAVELAALERREVPPQHYNQQPQYSQSSAQPQAQPYGHQAQQPGYGDVPGRQSHGQPGTSNGSTTPMHKQRSPHSAHSSSAAIAPSPTHAMVTSSSEDRGRTTAAAVDEPVSTNKGGLLGYLKSGMGILGMGGSKQSSVAPQPAVENQSDAMLTSNLTANELMSLEGGVEGNDNDSVFTNGSLYCAPNAVLPISSTSTPQEESAQGSAQPQSGHSSTDRLHLADLPVVDALPLEGPNTLPTALATPASPHDSSLPPSVDGSVDGPPDNPSSGAVSASQRLRSAASILQMDGEILQAVARVTSPTYKLTRSMVPKPKKIEPYPIYFNRGKNGFFEFNQVDFGVQFQPFMRDIVPAQDPRWQTHHDSLAETNRCFFLHFGVAMGIHPYALQQCFRCAAAELLKYPENEMTIFFGEALESLLLRNDFVDAQVLSAIWPLEFDRYKVLIVRVDHNGRIESFTSFRSELGPVDEQGEWAGEELIFTLQWNHFTILKPKSEQLNKPITAVLAAASMIGIMPLEFITKVDADPMKRFRICSS